MKEIASTAIFLLLLASCNPSAKWCPVNGDSMFPAIKNGDVITYAASFDSLDYADIVIFELPGNDDSGMQLTPFRVVGLPGDSIAIDNHICIINGKRNATTFIQRVKNKDAGIKELEYLSEREEVFPNGKAVNIYSHEVKFSDIISDVPAMYIPENHYFLMGDFRSNANDSRYLGIASKDKIRGKITRVDYK